MAFQLKIRVHLLCTVRRNLGKKKYLFFDRVRLRRGSSVYENMHFLYETEHTIKQQVKNSHPVWDAQSNISSHSIISIIARNMYMPLCKYWWKNRCPLQISLDVFFPYWAENQFSLSFPVNSFYTCSHSHNTQMSFVIFQIVCIVPYFLILETDLTAGIMNTKVVWNGISKG